MMYVNRTGKSMTELAYARHIAMGGAPEDFKVGVTTISIDELIDEDKMVVVSLKRNKAKQYQRNRDKARFK